jgi:hypothetical protein
MSAGATIRARRFGPEKERDMSNEYDPDTEKREMRAMWIFSAVVVLLILGLMVGNMILHPERMWPSTEEISSQSRTAPPDQH